MGELKKGVSIIMPCLNEEKTIGICVEKAMNFLKEHDLPGEVVIGDNGSSDDSIAIAEKLGARVVNVTEKGYGSALRGAIAASEYEYIIMGDADDSYNFSEIGGFIEKLDEGYELVMGNRFWGGIEPGAMSFSHQYIGNPILSGIGRIFFRTKIRDFHCGMRGFRKESIEKLGLCTTGMEFASEMVVKAVLFKIKMTEIPCKLYPDGRDRPPHLRSIPDGLRHLEFLLIYSPKWLFVYPGILLTAFGLVFMIMIYMQTARIGRVQFEVTSMFYGSIMMLIGFQMLQFAVFTGVFGKRIGQFPPDVTFSERVCSFIEKRGYLCACILFLLGFVGVVYTLVVWAQAGFGGLSTSWVAKTGILFGSLAAVGIEMFLFTVFSRVLQIGNQVD
ncbi:MAG: glycosyltransferase family 2 protein [Lachnospiraceae bacterium]|nr:glycosyltransferase family 2 protein [Lachnospiraceae bacterium]